MLIDNTQLTTNCHFSDETIKALLTFMIRKSNVYVNTTNMFYYEKLSLFALIVSK